MWMTADHRVPLGATSWFVWREALLRSTGFPADGLDRLGAPRCAAIADAYLAGGTELAAFEVQFAATLSECSRAVSRIAADRRLREAITWQNPAALRLLDYLAACDPATARDHKRRHREQQLTRYWQRYCAKNETIGFFGPALWARVDPGVAYLSCVPGERFVARRRVFLEPWALAAYGAVLADDRRTLAWLPPAPVPHHVVDGPRLRRPGLPTVTLSAEEAATLALCDGRRPAARIVAALVADPGLSLSDEAEGLALLSDLARRQLLRWDANLPVGPHTGAMLADRIAAIGDDSLRADALAGLDRLEAARKSVAEAAGDPDALAVALAALEKAFVDLTGRRPQRRPGRAYAGRRICYEDTGRDLTLVVGRQLLDGIAPALAVPLQVARWFTNELGRSYEDELQKLFRDALAENPQPTLADLWYPALKLLWENSDRPVDRLVETLRRRWRTLFESSAATTTRRLRFSSAELADRLHEIFPAERPGWSFARIHSPDIHLCASSVEAINNGDYLAVLGELHLSYATLSDRWCTWLLPDPGRILRLAIQDFGQPRIVPLLPPAWSKDAGRTVQIEDDASDRWIGFANAAGVHADRVTPFGAVAVSMAGGRLVGTMPDGSTWPLLEFFAHFLAGVTGGVLRDVSQEARTPRISVDRLVIFRETWRTTLGGLRELVTAQGEMARYLGARRLVAELGLPDRCFVRIATEPKPIYVDFTSPSYVGVLCTMLRASWESGGADTAVTISEMLPTPDQTWVRDRDGRRYFGEIRLHLTDPNLAQTLV